MAQFTLTWDNTDVLDNENAISQRALYRRKDIGVTWENTGFIPDNDMATSVVTANSPDDLINNIVYQFKIQAICTAGGPSDNDNGIRDMIDFACIEPVTGQTYESASIEVDLADTNITKARFTLKRSIDNVIIAGPTAVAKVSDVAELTVDALTAETDYYWEVELYANLNSAEVVSSSVGFIGTVCGPYPFTTDASPICDPVTSMTITSAPL